MRVISFDARTDVCLTAWEVGKRVPDCDKASSEEPVVYKTVFNTDTAELAYSIYQPTEVYRQFRAAPAEEAQIWRSLLPAVLAFALLLTTVSYVRYRTPSEGLMSSFTRSLSVKDSLNSSIHEILSSHLDVMSRFPTSCAKKMSKGKNVDILISPAVSFWRRASN